MIRHDWPSFCDEGEGGFWFGFVFGGAGFFFWEKFTIPLTRAAPKWMRNLDPHDTVIHARMRL